MKNDLNNFLYFLSKNTYSRSEVLIMVFLIFFITVIYSNTMEFALGLNNFSSEYLLRKVYLNWTYLLCSSFIILYAKIIQNNEFNYIECKLNQIEYNLNKLGD